MLTGLDIGDPANTGSFSTISCIYQSNSNTETNGATPCSSSPTYSTASKGAALPTTADNFGTSGTTGSVTVPLLTSPYAIIDAINFTNIAHNETVQYNANGQVRGAAAVPEPASLAIFGSALLGFGLLRRRRNG
jgi:hypothetical protein